MKTAKLMNWVAQRFCRLSSLAGNRPDNLSCNLPRNRAGMVLGVLVCFWLPGAAMAIEAVQYSINNEAGKQIGQQVVEVKPDGTVQVQFGFKNNGRGPDLIEQLRFASDGTLVQYQVQGQSEYGSRVDEHFERKGDQANWHSTSEKGSGPATGAALYLALNGSPFMESLVITQLKGQDGELPLLPNGKLIQRVLEKIQVQHGGQTREVQLLAHTGIGLGPSFFWATTGPEPRLFAALEPGHFSVIEQGWLETRDLMLKHQKMAANRMLEEMAGKLQQRISGLLVIKNARVFDSDKAQLTAAKDVYVLRGKITAVLPTGSPVRGAENEIDAGGRVLLPGLFDMHGHFSRWDGGLNLAAGVTTVRDMGNDNAQMQLMLDEIANGKLLAPQLVPCGFLEGESPFASSGGFLIRDLAGAKRAIDWYAEHGYPQLKIYNSFPKAILRETVAYAHARGMRVSGHVPVGLRAREVIAAGYDEIQHINQLLLNFLATPETETRNLNRFVLPAEKVGDLDFDSPAVKQLIATMKSKQIVLDQTLTAFDFLRQRDGNLSEPFAPVASHLPPDVKRSMYQGSMKIDNEATHQRYQKSYAKMIEFVGRLYRAGVPLVAGTDEFAGFALQSELTLLVKAGLTPAQALQVATKNGAKYSGVSLDRGSIVPGKLADLVLVDGDPTKDIGDVRKVALVITRGYLIYPEAIYQSMGIEPFARNAPALRVLPGIEVGQSH
jgi:imidazolonepropionase-like amidohydrolase